MEKIKEIIANNEHVFQNETREKRATELIAANKRINQLLEEVIQNETREKRAAELIAANKRVNQLLEELIQNDFRELSDYKYALDASSIIAITDQRGIIKKANSNFCKISKYSEQELIGQDHRIISSGYHSKEFIKNLWLTITNGKIWKGELRNKAKDGTIYWVDTTIVPFLNEQGKPYQYVAIRYDITLRKKIEEEMINKAAELEKFVFISSHNLQEPLRKIKTFSNLILETKNQNISDKVKNYLSEISLIATQMRTLLDDLISYSLSRNTIRKFEKIDLNVIIKEVIHELRHIIQDKHANIEVAKLDTANVIPFNFRLVMINLIGNALKFSRPNEPPHIIIKNRIVKGSELNNKVLSSRKAYYHISVKDNGIGFEPQYKDRIFEIFQRLHAQGEYEGTGTGLALVKNLVENMNGIITATSELNKGATFDIYIPVKNK